MTTWEMSSKIVNFMTSGAGVLALGYGHMSHNALFLNKSSSLTPRHGSDKQMIEEGSTQIINFMTLGAGDYAKWV